MNNRSTPSELATFAGGASGVWSLLLMSAGHSEGRFRLYGRP